MLAFRKPEFLTTTAAPADPRATRGALAGVERSPHLIPIARAEHRELLALAERMDEEHAKPLDVIQPWLLSALLRAFLLRAERLVGPRSPPHAGLATFFTILERDHMAMRSVAHYARASGLLVRRFAELLVVETGRSTKQLIDERVVPRRQKRLLAYTGVSDKGSRAHRLCAGLPTS
ncbi:MAG: hypothetical protein IPQ07_36775 [Myxococcales bacterium]|nr:hypothetical protein [Myxococcales bacterium]